MATNIVNPALRKALRGPHSSGLEGAVSPHPLGHYKTGKDTYLCHRMCQMTFNFLFSLSIQFSLLAAHWPFPSHLDDLVIY